MIQRRRSGAVQRTILQNFLSYLHIQVICKVRPMLCKANKLHGALGDADEAVDAPQLVVVALALRDAPRLLKALQRLHVVVLRGRQTRQLVRNEEEVQ